VGKIFIEVFTLTFWNTKQASKSLETNFKPGQSTYGFSLMWKSIDLSKIKSLSMRIICSRHVTARLNTVLALTDQSLHKHLKSLDYLSPWARQNCFAKSPTAANPGWPLFLMKSHPPVTPGAFWPVYKLVISVRFYFSLFSLFILFHFIYSSLNLSCCGNMAALYYFVAHQRHVKFIADYCIRLNHWSSELIVSARLIVSSRSKWLVISRSANFALVSQPFLFGLRLFNWYILKFIDWFFNNAGLCE